MESLLILIPFLPYILTIKNEANEKKKDHKKNFNLKVIQSYTTHTRKKKIRWEHSLTGSWLKWSCHLPDDLVMFDPVHDFYVSFLFSFVLPTSFCWFFFLAIFFCCVLRAFKLKLLYGQMRVGRIKLQERSTLIHAIHCADTHKQLCLICI